MAFKFKDIPVIIEYCEVSVTGAMVFPVYDIICGFNDVKIYIKAHEDQIQVGSACFLSFSTMQPRVPQFKKIHLISKVCDVKIKRLKP